MFVPIAVPPALDLVAQGHDLQRAGSPFFATLAAIASAHHWSDDADRYEQGGTMAKLELGRAVAAGNDVLVILENEAVSVPGVDAVELLLLAPDGTLLDKVGCEMNSRYGKLEVRTTAPMHAAVFAVDSDGYMGHTIAAHGQTYTFWPESELHAEAFTARRSTELESRVSVEIHYRRPRSPAWSRNGLLQVAVANDKLEVPFPALGIDDDHLDGRIRPSSDELLAYAQELAGRLLPVFAAHPLERGMNPALAFELHADGSIGKLHAIDNGEARAIVAPFVRAVRDTAFARVPLAVPEGIDVDVIFDRARDRGGMTESIAAESQRWDSYLATVKQRIAARHVRGEGSVELWVYPDGSTAGVRPDRWAHPADAAAAMAAVEHTAFPPLPAANTWPVAFEIGFGAELAVGCSP
ncbi:MAG TPA: hypothetical protein VGG28_09940 [Kofleriaceae bacterium]|jgi:hypothetical protein